MAEDTIQRNGDGEQAKAFHHLLTAKTTIMKKIFFSTLVLIISIGLMAQPMGEVIKLNADTYGFGKIKQGVPVTAGFILTNISGNPVVIESVNASCGCTVPDYSKEPIPAGGKSKVKVGYNAATPGTFDKAITIQLAGVPQSIAVRITGEVVNATDEPNAVVKPEVEARVNIAAWRRHLEANLREPLIKAANNGMPYGNHTVNVRFLVEKDGSISEAKALNNPGYGLAGAAEDIVKTGPRWKPGEQNGQPVRSYHTQPITFQITGQ